MKKIFILIFVLVNYFNIGTSQSYHSKPNFIQPMISKIMNNIKSIDINSFNDEVVFCQEYWELPYQSDSLVLEEESTVTISELEDNRFLYKMETEINDDELGDFTRVIKFYFRESFNDFEETNLDSVIVYILNGQLKIPYVNINKTYDGDKLIKSTDYYNWDFDFPPKFELDDSTNYFYDDKDLLITQTSYSIYSSDIGLTIVDSIVYSNDEVKKRPFQTVEFRINYDTDKIEINNLKNYGYDDEDRLVNVTTLTFNGISLSKLDGLETITYSENEKVKLYQSTTDQGNTWNKKYKDSTSFMPVLDLKIPKTEVHFSFKDSTWQISELRETHYCDAHASVKFVDNLMFDAYFSGSDLVIDGKTDLANANVKLYNINGQVLLDKYYSNLPHRIQMNNIIAGVYFLRIKDSKNSGVIKLAKFGD